MDFAYILTSTSGRIPRSQWWAGLVVLVVIAVVLGVIISWLLGGVFTVGGRIALLILNIVLLYPSYAISAKRFQDRGKPGKLALIGVGLAFLQSLLTTIGVMGNPFNQNALDWIFGVLLLIVGIWYLIELGFLRGTVGSNEYGPDPLEGR
ncbi:MAG: DUF805 domain-containing protein [Bauldia sp.]|uniref:DUF805 domain-containing protein n=1 Tax=Bauldia sp. TaxID=2575872 RepID=UPI001DFF9BED|nr:DUF805 domain-containing protein [Bauldia sp.]MCB1496661.1 DUF805 domain-containing protein [Bauldia sp.]